MLMGCCAGFLLLLILLGLGGKTLGASPWAIFIGIAVMFVAHAFMMGTSHKHSDTHGPIGKGARGRDNGGNKTHSGHGCCH